MNNFYPPLIGQQAQFGFYFHIPFCPHICPYCDFTKTSKFPKKDVILYFKELESQLDSFLLELNSSDSLVNFSHCTVYFGGGTPGLFPASYYEPLLLKIRETFLVEEVTLETNPFMNGQKKFQDYSSLGVNRVTIGAQSLCPQTLDVLGRKHSPEAVIDSVRWASQSGISDVQVDLIYGLKKQIRTVNIDAEIRTLAQAGATGISAYFLTLEKNTLFANATLVDEDNGVEEYEKVRNTCEELGFTQWETSNFCLRVPKHNNLYWYGRPYFGLGTGAHGLKPSSQLNPYGLRYRVGNLQDVYSPGDHKLVYGEQSSRKQLFEIIQEDSRTHSQAVQEILFTLLRTNSGVPLSWLQIQTGDKHCAERLLTHPRLKKGLQEGLLLLETDSLKVSSQEKIRGDAWALDIISALF